MELVSFLDHRKKSTVYKAKKGDKEAFLSLIDENRLNIYRVARGILKNEEDIKDAIQNTIIKAFENMCTLKKDEYFKTWLIRILINECNEILRKDKRSASLEKNMGDVTERYIDSYENMDLIQAINSLSEELRVTITLFYFDDIPVKTISEILETSEGTVKARLSRARAKLKEILGEDAWS
ncbi:sigma-70 family RNA polymerase sigma factor [Geosporobacter ferrireducens]|uniref:RNA polymerase subunit sigma-24 n=1 Tax=Geosporobacter ferrireducens TaxID=1424294 RepID=A0A1D8GFD8_9FIRM|nr:sigma-70 family RNA polymerase sigma factor [Geosporobacter ferrireducens]AOT69618.1 RNA polymerase subunit sigma-24 [Geosporobacter ferrireducens]MTI54680.1 sigma-70 family RNA polymerase sigma factor [Geosporobacter ferrireducens]